MEMDLIKLASIRCYTSQHVTGVDRLLGVDGENCLERFSSL